MFNGFQVLSAVLWSEATIQALHQLFELTFLHIGHGSGLDVLKSLRKSLAHFDHTLFEQAWCLYLSVTIEIKLCEAISQLLLLEGNLSPSEK